MPDVYPFHYDMPKVRISDSEIAVQKACLNMIARVFPRTRVAAVPNGGKRTRWQQTQAKREGVSAGFPDLILTGPRGRTAYVEIKAKAAMSDEQKDWLVFMVMNDHFCGVFRSHETLMFKMREWGFQ